MSADKASVDFQRGLEDGIRCGESPMYAAGFEQGRRMSENAFGPGAVHGADPGAYAFLEGPAGIPAGYRNPLEANSLEKSLLVERPHGLRMGHYLRNGYAVYLTWLKDKARLAGLTEHWDDYLTFAVARHINAARDGLTPMGEDIERVALSDDPPTMRTQEFYVRLRDVPDEILNEHSAAVWRGTDAMTQSGDAALSLGSLERGDGYAPACGFHLGLAMLDKNGYLDAGHMGGSSVSDAAEYESSRNLVVVD